MSDEARPAWKSTRYRLLDRVGKGASSQVFRAHDAHLDRDVAIKIIDPRLLVTPSKRKRYLKEARIHARLEHTNIVRIYDILLEDDQLSIVMSYIDGISMSDLLSRSRGRLDLARGLDYFRQVLQGVSFIHSKGVIHQDLKPHNVQIDRDHVASLIDFGIAARIEDQSVMHRTHKVKGSPAYMSPEQAEGRFLDARTDIYSLGMVLYQLCAGRHPFSKAQTVAQILSWQIERMPPPPSSYRPHLSLALDEVILRALAKKGRKRFRSCREFEIALRELSAAGDLPTVDDEDGRWDPRAEVALKTRILVGDDVQAEEARTIDVSATGLALWSPALILAGTEVTLEIEMPAGEGSASLRTDAEVVWNRPEDGGYRLGLRFVRMSDKDRRVVANLVRDALVFGV